MANESSSSCRQETAKWTDCYCDQLKPPSYSVSRSRAYELIAQGTIPSIKLGTSLRVPFDALRIWIAEQLPEAVMKTESRR